MTTNEQFAAYQKEIVQIREWLARESQLDSEFHKAYFNELVDWYYTLPDAKHRKDREKAIEHARGAALKHDAGKAIDEKWREKAKAIHTEKRTRIEHLKALMEELAPQTDLTIERTPDAWTLYRWFYASSYNSTGSPERYLDSSIETMKDHLRQYIPEEDMKVEDTPGGKNLLICYSGNGAEILKLRPHLELRTVVKNMMKRGTNPRVFYPMLPHGYEAKMGLDYFGNDLPIFK